VELLCGEFAEQKSPLVSVVHIGVVENSIQCRGTRHAASNAFMCNTMASHKLRVPVALWRVYHIHFVWCMPSEMANGLRVTSTLYIAVHQEQQQQQQQADLSCITARNRAAVANARS
jgi:hypothetical protein